MLFPAYCNAFLIKFNQPLIIPSFPFENPYAWFILFSFKSFKDLGYTSFCCLIFLRHRNTVTVVVDRNCQWYLKNTSGIYGFPKVTFGCAGVADRSKCYLIPFCRKSCKLLQIFILPE